MNNPHSKKICSKKYFVQHFTFLCLLSVLVLSCKQRDYNTETTTEGLKVSGVTGPEFHKGLFAKVGSLERRNAGESFERELRDKIFSTLPQPENDEHLAQIQLTQKALFFTAQYLKYGQECLSKEKITVFRGHNRPYLKSNLNGLFDVVYAPVWRNKAIRVAEQPWKDWIWETVKNTSANEQSSENLATPKGKWSDIINVQNSSESFLLNVTLSPELASKKGNFTAKLEVCPERIWPAYGSKKLSELEFYMPLFILPEEIVSDSSSNNSEKYSPGSLSNYTPQIERCYANLGLAADFSKLKNSNETSEENKHFTRYNRVSSSFYQAMNLANNSKAWRDWYPNLEQICEVDCALAKDNLKGLGEKLTTEGKDMKIDREYSRYNFVYNKFCGAGKL
jgi:hypothetical protein